MELPPSIKVLQTIAQCAAQKEQVCPDFKQESISRELDFPSGKLLRKFNIEGSLKTTSALCNSGRIEIRVRLMRHLFNFWLKGLFDLSITANQLHASREVVRQKEIAC